MHQGDMAKHFSLRLYSLQLRGMGKIALAVASSGIAAELLGGGRTAYSRFMIPIPVNEESVCSNSLQSDIAKLIKRTSLIMWDEIMMNHAHQTDCVDRSLRDILKVDKPFGGIAMVFGGDPRQILPVVHHGNRAHIVKACIHPSSLWGRITQVKLSVNTCVVQDEINFSRYLLNIGNGTAKTYPEVGEDVIQIPRQCLVESVDTLISKVFPDIENGYPEKYFLSWWAILTTLNDNVDKLNEIINFQVKAKPIFQLTLLQRKICGMYIQLNSWTQLHFLECHPIQWLWKLDLLLYYWETWEQAQEMV